MMGNMASIYNKLGRRDRAIEMYRKSLQIKSDQVNNRYNLAKLLASMGDFQNGRKEVEILINMGLREAEYYGFIGFCDLWLEQPARSLQELQQALKLDPRRADVLLSIGSCFSSMGYFERAEWFQRRAMEIGGRSPIVLLSMMQNALRSDNPSKARKIFQHLLNVAPLPQILKTLEPSDVRYGMVPLDAKHLREFIAREIGAPGLIQ